MRNKLVYSCRVKICTLGLDKLLESIFCILLVVDVYFVQKSCQDAWRSSSWLAEVRWIYWMRQNFVAQFLQLLVVRPLVRCCRGEELGPFCWPIPAAVFGDFIDLLSILLKYNGFTGIQKAAVDQTSSSKQWPWPFFGASLALGSALELLSPTTELIIAGCCIQFTFHCRSQSQLRNGLLLLHRIREDDTSKWLFFFDLQSAHVAPTYQVFHFSNLL